MFLVLSCIRHWFVLIFTVSYLFLFFITGLHSEGGYISAHVTDVTSSHIMCLSQCFRKTKRKLLLKNTLKTSMNDEHTHSTQSPLEGPKYIKNICTKKKRQNILLTNTINETKRCKSDGHLPYIRHFYNKSLARNLHVLFIHQNFNSSSPSIKRSTLRKVSEFYNILIIQI
jgi:hypothetical protein